MKFAPTSQGSRVRKGKLLECSSTIFPHKTPTLRASVLTPPTWEKGFPEPVVGSAGLMPATEVKETRVHGHQASQDPLSPEGLPSGMWQPLEHMWKWVGAGGLWKWGLMTDQDWDQVGKNKTLNWSTKKLSN